MTDGISYTGDLPRYVLDREQFEISTDNRSIKIAFAMSVIEKVGEFLNTLTMQYELRYKW